MSKIRLATVPPPRPLDLDAVYLVFCDVVFASLAGVVGGLCMIAGGWKEHILGGALLLTACTASSVAVCVKRRARGSWAGSWVVLLLVVVFAGLLIWYTATTKFNGEGSEVGIVGYAMLLFAGHGCFLLMSRPEILNGGD